MRKFITLIISIVILCISCNPTSLRGSTERVLFVGNSLTYVGNVPAVYSALAEANGHSTTSDMIVRGGATLSQRVADGSVKNALSQGNYTAMVIQERGGDLICSFGPDSCVESRAAIHELAALAEEDGLKVVLLGTYQPHPISSRRIVEKEFEAASKAGITYAEVSETFRDLREREPGLTWFADDGMHPGRDLALLNAVQVYEALHEALPAAAPLRVTAPIYGTTSGLDERLRGAEDPPPLADTPGDLFYSSETVQKLLSVISGGGRQQCVEAECSSFRKR